VKESSRRSFGVTSLAVAAGIAAILACASPPPMPTYQEQLSRWQGEGEEDLVSAWGMPQQTHTLADGGRVLEYRSSADGGSSCTTRFTVDRTGVIMRWWYAGVKCSAPS